MVNRNVLTLLVLSPALAPGLALAQTGPDAKRVRLAEQVGARCGGELRVRWDGETGVPASLTFEGAACLEGAEPVEAARGWLERELAPLFEEGLTVVASDRFAPGLGPVLVMSQARALGEGRVQVVFTQRSGAVEVQDAGVAVELEQTADGWVPVALSSRYFPGVPAKLAVTAPLAVEAELAERYGPVQAGELTIESSCTRKIVPSAAGFALACVVETFDPATSSTWRIAFDADSGQELSRTRLGCCATARGLAYDKNPGQSNRAAVPLTNLYVFQGNQRQTTDAKGEHSFTGMVSLDQGLAGPLLRVFVTRREELTYTGPANIDLAPNEASDEQDQLAAWHNYVDFNTHLKSTYARFAASGAITTRFAMSVRYTQNGAPYANAFFSPQGANGGGESFPDGWIAMGTFGGGTREAARSSSVIQHEYCHALFSQVVSLTGSLQAGGINEGLADYLPAAFKNDPVLGAWLAGNNGIRDLRQDFRWPQDDNGDVHRVGHILAGALWDAREAAEARTPGDKLEIDQAVVEGIFRMRNRPSLTDAREAILAGDRAANGGGFRVTLTQAFADHGIGPAPSNGAPSVGPIPSQTVRAGETLSLVVPTDDPDGDPVAVTASPLVNGSLDPRTSTWTFAPDRTQVGSHTVTFTGSDEELSQSISVDVEVLPAAAGAPVAGGGIAPVSSSTAAASTAARGGGGGGGGCSLASTPRGAGGAAWLLLLGLGALLRARSKAGAGFRDGV